MRNLRLFIAVSIFILSAWIPRAEAGTFTLRWDPAAGATSYDIESSVDGQTAWSVIKAAVPASACVGTPVVCSTSLTVAAGTMAHYRAVGINAVGRTPNYMNGAWRCENCAPPPAPANLGSN